MFSVIFICSFCFRGDFYFHPFQTTSWGESFFYVLCYFGAYFCGYFYLPRSSRRDPALAHQLKFIPFLLFNVCFKLVVGCCFYFFFLFNIWFFIKLNASTRATGVRRINVHFFKLSRPALLPTAFVVGCHSFVVLTETSKSSVGKALIKDLCSLECGQKLSFLFMFTSMRQFHCDWDWNIRDGNDERGTERIKIRKSRETVSGFSEITVNGFDA